jgi:predicted HicB family RNase H-like nuclease
MNDQGYVQMVLRVTPEAKHRLKMHAVSTGQTMNSLVEQAVEEIIRREAIPTARSAAVEG